VHIIKSENNQNGDRKRIKSPDVFSNTNYLTDPLNKYDMQGGSAKLTKNSPKIPMSLEKVYLETEISQLKKLNLKLINENSDLQDQVNLFNQKKHLELAVGDNSSANVNKLEAMIQK
jgi:hypothetical protein